jgi:hypothetical protein
MSMSLGIATDGLFGGTGGGVTYRMRARDASLGRYVFWDSEDSIDTLGAQYTGPGPLTDIVVQAVIGS